MGPDIVNLPSDRAVQSFAGTSSNSPAAAQHKNLPPSPPGPNRGRIGVHWKPHAPIQRQRQAAIFGALEHPNQRDIGQGARLFLTAQVPANVAMAAAKPDLFHPPIPPLRAVPQNRRKDLARFI